LEYVVLTSIVCNAGSFDFVMFYVDCEDKSVLGLLLPRESDNL